MRRSICGCLCLLCLCWITLQAQAGRRKVMENPGFVLTNTEDLEIRRIVLTDEQTQVEVVMYGKPGTPAVFSSKAALKWADGGVARLRDAGGASVDGLTEPEVIADDGKLDVTLSFAPIRSDVHEVDFVDPEMGWNIFGIQLSSKEPYVYVPNYLTTDKPERRNEIPEPGLAAGKAVVNGYILGYDPRMSLFAELVYKDGIFPEEWKRSIKVRQDGSFHLETELLQPTLTSLRLNEATLQLFLVPDEEVTVYVHLPRVSMASSRFLGKHYEKKQKAWFDGAAETINMELAGGRSSALEAYRVVEKKMMESPDVASLLKADYQKAVPVCARLAASSSLSSDDRKILKSVNFPEIRTYVEAVAQSLQANAKRMDAVREAVIVSLDSHVTGADILPKIIAPHKGRAILIDFWATWCGPCRKSMQALVPLKKSLSSKDIVYVYLTGPSSPENVWKSTLSKMTGVHYRLTEAQWKYLCASYGVTGIPAYLIISHDGKLQARYIGFPGVDVLQKDLIRAVEE